MADPEDVVELEGDEEMAEADEEVEAGDDEAANGEGEGETGLEAIEPTVPERTTFLDYLRSPIIELVLGNGAEATTLHAHQALLTKSPFFAGECARFTGTSPETSRRQILLPNDGVDAAAAVLEWLYKADYFPAMAPNGGSLEEDPWLPAGNTDDEGVGLLRHARVYTLAQRLGLPLLAALAHKKIHMTGSTAKGEIAYARFVYAETSPDDTGIRKPVAAFWATRSHVLRHEAEMEFRRMCLEFPQFGFDVLSLVLDQQEKRSQGLASSAGPGRKRQRVSGVEIR